MKDRKERIDALKSLIIEKIPISEVISSRIETNKNKGQALCPFHDDKKIGNFHFNDSRGIYKCFSCNTGGNAIHFVMKYENISFSEAVCSLAAEFKLISNDEYKELTSKTFNRENKEFKPLVKVNYDSSIMKDDDALDMVYSIMTKGEKLVDENADTLSQEHLEILLEKRGLTQEQIETRGYFTFPKDKRKYLSAISAELRKRDLNPKELLLGIPGFYWNKKYKRVEMSKINGLVIPIKNCNEQIIAFQIRKDVVKGDAESRYIWYSSLFTNDQKNIDTMDSGCSPVRDYVPVDVVYPKDFKRNSVLITEGHFKAICFSNRYDCVSLSVQGVGNYQEVPQIISELELLCPQGTVDNVIIAYDADICVNEQVFIHSLNLGKLIKSNLRKNVYYYLWDMEKGKGIDDLLINNDKPLIKRYELSDYAWTMSKYFEILTKEEERLNKKLSKLDKYEIFKQEFEL